MKANLNNDLLAGSRNVTRIRFIYGMIYGVIAGLAFASSTWGWDGYLLSHTYVFMPWLKLVLGAVLCGLAGGLAGWMTIRYERWWITFISWLAVAFVFTWFVIVVPLQISQMVSKLFHPQWSELIHYRLLGEIAPRFWLAFMWVAIFVGLAGILEVVLVESTLFASSFIGRIAPLFLCVTILGICGVIVDGLNNEPLRRAIINMDSTVQFVLDHRGQVMDKAEARENHAGTLRVFTDNLSVSRELLLAKYDTQLGEIILLVNFDDLLLNCTVLYGQPAFCAPPE